MKRINIPLRTTIEYEFYYNHFSIFKYHLIVLFICVGIYFESLRIPKEKEEDKQVYHELLVVGYGYFNGKRVFKFRNFWVPTGAIMVMDIFI